MDERQGSKQVSIVMGLVKNLSAAALLSGFFLAGSASSAMALVTMYGSVGNGSGPNRGDILQIDRTDTSINTVVGNPTTSGGITGIDFDNSRRLWGSQLFGFNSTSTLIQINPNDGSLINTVGDIHTDAGDPAGTRIAIGDLAYNPITDQLYGITSDAGPPGGFPGDGIYTIDTGTGLATFVGPTIWDTNAGIAFDTAGTLYALGFDPNVNPGVGGTNMLFTLDSVTGAELTRVTVDINDFIFSGLAIDPETGVIYATESRTGNIYTVDENTGEMTFTGKPDGAFVSDLAFRIPEPGTLAVLGIGLLGLAATRRRRAI